MTGRWNLLNLCRFTYAASVSSDSLFRYRLLLLLRFPHPRYDLSSGSLFRKKVLYHNLYSKYLRCNLPPNRLQILHREFLYLDVHLSPGFLRFLLYCSLYRCKFYSRFCIRCWFCYSSRVPDVVCFGDCFA